MPWERIRLNYFLILMVNEKKKTEHKSNSGFFKFFDFFFNDIKLLLYSWGHILRHFLDLMETRFLTHASWISILAIISTLILMYWRIEALVIWLVIWTLFIMYLLFLVVFVMIIINISLLKYWKHVSFN